MFRISRKIEFCLMILKHFSNHQKKQSSTIENYSEQDFSNAFTIAQKYKISFRLTQKMLQKLKQNKILTSTQGTKGGYRLIKDLEEISFLELLEAIEGPMIAVRCINDKKMSCSYFDGCVIIDPMKNLNDKLRNFYANIFLDELINISFKRRKNKKED